MDEPLKRAITRDHVGKTRGPKELDYLVNRLMIIKLRNIITLHNEAKNFVKNYRDVLDATFNFWPKGAHFCFLPNIDSQ